VPICDSCFRDVCPEPAVNASPHFRRKRKTVEESGEIIGAIVLKSIVERGRVRRVRSTHGRAHRRINHLQWVYVLTVDPPGANFTDAVAFRATRVALRWRGLFRLAAAQADERTVQG